MKTIVPRMGGINFEPGKVGAVYPKPVLNVG